MGFWKNSSGPSHSSGPSSSIGGPSSSNQGSRGGFSPNPNPWNHKIIDHRQVGSNLVLLVQYPDATSYEGNKILVFRNTKKNALDHQVWIDPHFDDKPDAIHPFARFEPTLVGWTAAISCAKLV